MLQNDQLEKEDVRLSGHAASPQAKVPTYQDLLDETLDNTFPASDPIAASAATHVREPHTTARDTHDWTLEPGACKPVGQACDDGKGRPLSEPCPARLTRALGQQDGLGASWPPGECKILQSDDAAVLIAEGRKPRQLPLSLESLRRLQADGTLVRSMQASAVTSASTPDPEPASAPGDEAPAGTQGTGEKECPACGGSGISDGGGDCPCCKGTGKVTAGIGGG